MPWNAPKFVEIGEKVFPSFLANNLSADGRGRFAFSHGAKVQCTRKHDKKQGRNNFTLAMKADGVEVTETFWWRSVPKFSRALLVVGTDSPPQAGRTSVQVWDTRSGRGTRVFGISFGTEESRVSFARGLGSAVKTDGTPVLFVGMSNGDVHGFEVNQKSQLERRCILKGLTFATSCVAGETIASTNIAASDERGNIAAWTYAGGSWNCVYRHQLEGDYCCALGIKGHILVSGQSSGMLGFHDIEASEKLAEAITNAKAITCLDIHPIQEIVLVGGEDCRVTVLTFPREGIEEVRWMLSVSQNGIVVGARFTCAPLERIDFALLLWESTYLVKYEYEDS